MIPLAKPDLTAEDVARAAEVMASGQLVQGANVAALEAAVADLTGAKHAVAVSSGTAALHLALIAAGVGPGTAVAVTAYSWIATANVIELCGATPLFVDIDPVSFNMSPEALARALEASELPVSAVLPIDAFGLMADMPRLSEICAPRDIPLIEDAACSLGSRLAGVGAGAWGFAGCFSLHPRKQLTTGEGGLLTTNSREVAALARSLRNHGADPDSPTQDFVRPGLNYRMADFSAALGVSQAERYTQALDDRRQLAAGYIARLADVDVTPPLDGYGDRHSWQSFVVVLPADLAGRVREVIAATAERGVQTQVGTLHMPLATYYRETYGYDVGDFPATDDVAARALTLPLWRGMTAADQDTVVEVVAETISDLRN